MALVEELLAQLPDAPASDQFTVVCADVDTADLASRRLRNAVAVLDPEDSGVTGGPLLIVSPRADQVMQFLRLLRIFHTIVTVGSLTLQGPHFPMRAKGPILRPMQADGEPVQPCSLHTAFAC